MTASRQTSFPPLKPRPVWPLMVAGVLVLVFMVWASLVVHKRNGPLPQRTIEVDGQVIQVEVASTPAQQERGLMERTLVPRGTGMLFVFDRDQSLSFWMRNTRVPLDILFFDAQHTLINVAQAAPCPDAVKDCPTYPSERPGRFVLELGAGEAARLGLAPGDRFQVRKP